MKPATAQRLWDIFGRRYVGQAVEGNTLAEFLEIIEQRVAYKAMMQEVIEQRWGPKGIDAAGLAEDIMAAFEEFENCTVDDTDYVWTRDGAYDMVDDYVSNYMQEG